MRYALFVQGFDQLKEKYSDNIANTIKGKGSSVMENKANWHHKVPGEEELAQIRQKAERMERIAKAGGDWPLADQEFHMAIIKASHNEYMRRLYPIINGAVNEILQVSVNRAHMQSIAIADNYMILDFLMQRDEAGARHAMSIHIRHLLNTLKG